MKLGLASLLSAATGFIALSYEILWFRTYGFASLGEAHCFGHLLGSYLLGLAIGAWITKKWCTTATAENHGQTVATAGKFVAFANIAGYLVVPAAAFMIKYVPHRDWTPEYGFAPWTLPLYALAAAFLGTTLPLIAHAAVPPDERAGVGLARLYVANIIGSTLGSLATGFILMDLLPLRHIAQILGLLGGALGFALVFSQKKVAGKAGAAGVFALALVLVTPWMNDALYGRLWERLRYKQHYTSNMKFAHIVENKSGVICVDASGGVYGGGAYDGAFNVDPVTDINQIRRAYALSVLHPNPKSVLMIGLGSGSWAQAIANHPTVERLVVIEINPGYVEILRDASTIGSLLDKKNVEIVIDDGRRWLNRHAEKFDFIFQNTTHHWRGHCTNLVSREYLELVDRHLNEGGVSYSNTTGSAAVARTVCEVFPHTRQYRSFIAGSHRPLTFDQTQATATLIGWTIDGAKMFDPKDPKTLEPLQDILGAGKWEERAATLTRTKEFPVITDDNMASEFRR